MELITVRIEKPEAVNFILGQSHLIKTVEDLHGALVGAAPGSQFGLAFCEASAPALVRWSGTNPDMIARRQVRSSSIPECRSMRWRFSLRKCHESRFVVRR